VKEGEEGKGRERRVRGWALALSVSGRRTHLNTPSFGNGSTPLTVTDIQLLSSLHGEAHVGATSTKATEYHSKVKHGLDRYTCFLVCLTIYRAIQIYHNFLSLTLSPRCYVQRPIPTTAIVTMTSLPWLQHRVLMIPDER